MDSSDPGNRILLVSGDYEACDELADVLRRQGYAVDFAYDSQSALELARRNRYETAILDHWPPFLDAVGLWNRMRKSAADSVILLLGGPAQATGIPAAVMAAVDCVVPKPPRTRDLLSLVDGLLTSRCELIAV